MQTNWKISDVQKKLDAGTIQGFVMDERRKEPLKEPSGKIVSKHFTQRSKEKDFIAWCLWDFAQRHGVILFQEYRFHEERKWRFDWAIPDMKIAFEYEGQGQEIKSGPHTSFKNFNKDVDKYNEAQQLGWTVLRFTFMNYKTLPQALKKFEHPSFDKTTPNKNSK